MITKTRKQVGSGQDVYKAAVAALKNWAHLQLGGYMRHTPVAVLAIALQQQLVATPAGRLVLLRKAAERRAAGCHAMSRSAQLAVSRAYVC